MYNLTNLLDELLLEICLKLQTKDILKLTSCNKKLYHLSKCKRLWQLLSFRDFNIDKITTAHKVYIYTYRGLSMKLSYLALYIRLYEMMIKSINNGFISSFRKYILYEEIISDVRSYIKSGKNDVIPHTEDLGRFINDMINIKNNQLVCRCIEIRYMDTTENKEFEFKISRINSRGIIPTMSIFGNSIMNDDDMNVRKRAFFNSTTLEYNENINMLGLLSGRRIDVIDNKTVNYILTFK